MLCAVRRLRVSFVALAGWVRGQGVGGSYTIFWGGTRSFLEKDRDLCPSVSPMVRSYFYKVETHRRRVLFPQQELPTYEAPRKEHSTQQPTPTSAMGPSTWPGTEIPPCREDTLLQAARLRPFGVNYLQGGKLTAERD